MTQEKAYFVIADEKIRYLKSFEELLKTILEEAEK